MTGLYIVAAAVLLAAGFGLYRRATDGRVRATTVRGDRLDTAALGTGLGPVATFVQFSSEVCAPCRVTSRLLGDVTSAQPGVEHVELDAEQRLDLVERFGVTRTPTVLVLDADGTVRSRIVGAPRKPDVLAALRELGAKDGDQQPKIAPHPTRRG